MRPILCLLALVALASASTRDWVVDSQNAPLRLTGGGNGSFTVKNRSEKQVSTFTLGCVHPSGKKYIVLHRFPVVVRALDRGWSMDSGIMDAPYTEEYAECVVKRAAKMAVLRVTFKGGGVWNADEATPSAKT